MSKISFTVPPEYEGAMVKGFLRSYAGMSARMLTRLKKYPEGIQVNGTHARAIDVLKSGDLMELILPQEENPTKAVALPVTVQWEDEHVIIFDKPPGMPVHPSPGHGTDTLANAAAAYARKQGAAWKFCPVNRLDRDTSGLVAVAKDSYTAAGLSRTGIQKEYIAVCQGELKGEGTIRLPIRLKKGHRIQREVGNGGQLAITHWKAMKTQSCHTLLRIWLETGRTHQIRVHFSSLGMPLAGDDLYGGSQKWITRQALHCCQMTLLHPVTGQQIQLKSPFPNDLVALCKKLKI